MDLNYERYCQLLERGLETLEEEEFEEATGGSLESQLADLQSKLVETTTATIASQFKGFASKITKYVDETAAKQHKRSNELEEQIVGVKEAQARCAKTGEELWTAVRDIQKNVGNRGKNSSHYDRTRSCIDSGR